MNDELRIPLDHGRFLSSFREGDEPALVRHLASKDVYKTTLNIPHPYTEADAYFWIRKRKDAANQQGFESTFAIREVSGELIGAVGADEMETAIPRVRKITANPISPTFRSHRAEIGYWIAPQFWGKGIMTNAVAGFVRYAFEQFELSRLTAHVFSDNISSARVLEKNGFKLEGTLRQHFLKDGRMLDALVYGLLKSEYKA